jgi:ribonuclease P protein component
LNTKFPKRERLVSQKIIQTLFKKGKNTFKYPFKILYFLQEQPSQTPPQVLISVSKKNFKRAVHRNWIKRRIKEAYRLNKHLLEDQNQKHKIYCMGIIYVAKEKIAFREIQQKMVQLFEHFKQ